MEVDLMLAQVVGFALALALPFEEAQLLSCEIDHQRRMEGLNESLSSLLGAPAPIGNDEAALEQALEWQTDYDDVRLSIVREDCCHHLPLGNVFGEQLENPELLRAGWPTPEYWLNAPGVDGNG